MHGLFCFNLVTEDKTYMVAATTEVERSKWMEVNALIQFCVHCFRALVEMPGRNQGTAGNWLLVKPLLFSKFSFSSASLSSGVVGS